MVSPSRDGTASGRKPGARAQLLSCIRRTHQTSTGCPCTVPADQPASRSRLVASEPISSGRTLRTAGTIQRNGNGPSWLGFGGGAALKAHRPPVRFARSNLSPRARAARDPLTHKRSCVQMSFMFVGGTWSALEEAGAHVPLPRVEPPAAWPYRPLRASLALTAWPETPSLCWGG